MLVFCNVPWMVIIYFILSFILLAKVQQSGLDGMESGNSCIKGVSPAGLGFVFGVKDPSNYVVDSEQNGDINTGVEIIPIVDEEIGESLMLECSCTE